MRITYELLRFTVPINEPSNERAEELAKTATVRVQVDVVVKLTTDQAKKILLTRALENWQTLWDHSSTGRRTYEIFS